MKDEEYDVIVSEDTVKSVTMTVTNGNHPADLLVTFLAISGITEDCQARWIPETGDSLSEFVVGGNTHSQIEWVETGMFFGESRDVTRTYTVHCSAKSLHDTFDPVEGGAFELQFDVRPVFPVVEEDDTPEKVQNNVHKNWPTVTAFELVDLKVVSASLDAAPIEEILAGDGFDDDEDCVGDAPSFGSNPPWPNNSPFQGACSTSGGVDEDPIDGIDNDGDCVGAPPTTPPGPCATSGGIDEDGAGSNDFDVNKVLHNNGLSVVDAQLTVTGSVSTLFGTVCLLVVVSPDDEIDGPSATGTLDLTAMAVSTSVPVSETYNIICDRPAGADVDDDGDLAFDEDPIDGVDNDNDGLEDGTAVPGSPGQDGGDCDDGIDNDADTLVDAADPDCAPFIDEDPGKDLATITLTNCIASTTVHVKDLDSSNDCSEIVIPDVLVGRPFNVVFAAYHDDDAVPSDGGSIGFNGIPGDGDDTGTPPLDTVCKVQLPCEQLQYYAIGGGDPLLANFVSYVPFDFDIRAGLATPNGVTAVHFEALVRLQLGPQGLSCRSTGDAPAISTPLPVILDAADGALPAAAGEGPDDPTAVALIDPTVWPTRLAGSGTLAAFFDAGLTPHARYVGIAIVGPSVIPVNIIVFEDTIGVTATLPNVQGAAATATQGWAHVSITGDPSTPAVRPPAPHSSSTQTTWARPQRPRAACSSAPVCRRPTATSSPTLGCSSRTTTGWLRRSRTAPTSARAATPTSRT